MKIEDNTTKKKWITPRKLGLSSKKTKAGNTTWLAEGATITSRICNTNTFSNHTGTSNTNRSTSRTCNTNVSTGQS